MPHAIAQLPPDQLAALERGYQSVVRARQMTTLLGLAVLAAAIVLAGWVGEVDLEKLLANLWRFPDYLYRILPKLSLATLGADIAEWLWGWQHWLKLLGETLLIAYVGTLAGALAAAVLAFFAAANVTPSWGILVATRRFLEFCRTVPEIVFALIFVVAFGLGPIPGVLALTIHTLGALGKLFAEVIENIDMKPVEGVTAAGGSWIQAMRFAALPQVLSSFLSYGLLRFEINVRGAAIMGFVGAGGIGQDLLESIRKFYYSDVSAILLFIIVTVMAIDLVTERLRHRLIGMEGRA